MERFTTLTGVAAPLPMDHVDTDKIIPARFLKTIKRTGLARGLFHDLRHHEDGQPRADFVLHQPKHRDAKILITGENFGCGSSREHAPWALVDHGIRCVIAHSFADIFYNNCFKNGLLPIALPDRDHVAALMDFCERDEEAVLTVDLHGQKISAAEGILISFEVDPFRKHCLVNGLDDIGLTLERADRIEAFEHRHRQAQPWHHS